MGWDLDDTCQRIVGRVNFGNNSLYSVVKIIQGSCIIAIFIE
jgi:hypothetical protein